MPEITSERQRRFFQSELEKAKSGEPRKTTMPQDTLQRHLDEVKNKSLKERSRRQAAKKLLGGNYG